MEMEDHLHHLPLLAGVAEVELLAIPHGLAGP